MGWGSVAPAAGGGGANPWLKIAETVAPLALGIFAGKKNQAAANQTSQGARLQDVLPQIQALIAQSQQHNQQNFDLQMQKYQGGAPLRDAMMQQALGLTPNYAKSGPSAPSLAPASAVSSAPTPLAMPPSPANLTAGYTRRGGGTGGAASGAVGGALSGAGVGSIIPGVGTAIGAGVGALAGGIKGAFDKHAKTAPTDFTVQDAREILTRAYTQYFGTAADPRVIEDAIRGQGWEPGDRWVGEGGLQSILHAWQQHAGGG